MKSAFLHIKFWGKRIAFSIAIPGIFLLVIFLRYPRINLGNYSLFNPLYEVSYSDNFDIFLVKCLISLFVLNAVLLILLTVYYKIKKRQKEKAERKYEAIFTERIIDQLVLRRDNEDKPEFIQSMKEYLKKDCSAFILIDVLRRIHSTVKGELREEIRRIAKDLEIEKTIRIYLHSPYTKDKVIALKFISAFRFEGYLNYIGKLAKKRDYIVRTEAFNALIQLTKLQDLNFLYHNKHVSLWDINSILNVSREFDAEFFDYKGLISSDMPRVSALGIALAAEYDQRQYKEIIRTKLYASDEILKLEAYKAFISMMDNPDDFKLMIHNFRNESFKIKRLIVSSFSKCPDREFAAVFLMNVVEQEPLVLKTFAMKILLDIDAKKVQRYRDSQSGEVLLAHKEAVDLYITN